jgi:drug/metabolite transporter (DMT)-like permease
VFARFAPFLFVLLWSSSFIAAKAGLRHMSPLLFVAVRMAGCAVVLIALMLILRRSWRPLAGGRWLHCAIAGALLNAVGLMAPHVGLLLAPAAQIALVQSLTPLLTAILGVALLPSATAQFASAAAVSALGAWLLETPRAEWTQGTFVAIAWNTVMVSLGGMGLYFAMLTRGSAARVSANFYLVPGTAALLAWMGERLSPLAITGLLVASAGCWLVSAKSRRTA